MIRVVQGKAPTSDVVCVGGQGLDGTEQADPILLEESGIGDHLPVSLNLSLASMVVDGDIEAIGNVELDDKQEPAEHLAL